MNLLHWVEDTPARALPSTRRPFANSVFGFVALAAAAVAGFWTPYVSPLLAGAVGVGALVHVHAAAMTAWCALLIAQGSLARTGRYALHRRLGAVSYALVPVVAASILALAYERLQTGVTPMRAFLLFVQLSTLLVFLLAYALAVVHRATPALHARYMIATALTQIDPVLARVLEDLVPPLPFPSDVVSIGLAHVILAGLIVAERRQRHGRTAFPLMLAVLAVAQLGQYTLGRSAWWLAAARRLAGTAME